MVVRSDDRLRAECIEEAMQSVRATIMHHSSRGLMKAYLGIERKFAKIRSKSLVTKLEGQVFSSFSDLKMQTMRLLLVITFLFSGSTSCADVALYKHIDLSKNSVENCRMSVGDLNGDKKTDFVFNDGRRTIKAFDSEGNLLWEKFNPNDPGVEERYHNFTIQNYDIDLDGKDEVICFLELDAENCLAIINGETGKIESRAILPFPAPRDHPFWGNTNYYMQDHVAIANLRGLSVPQDILAIHASKQKVAGYSYEDGTLRLLWFWVTDTNSYASGHYAYPYDIDGDGKDEVLAGVDVLDDDGTRMWIMPLRNIGRNKDHVDSLVVADIDPDNAGMEIVVCSESGVYMFDKDGNELWFNQSCYYHSGRKCIFPGEGGQEILVGNFRTDLTGLEIVAYSESMSGPDSVIMFDKNGNQLTSGNQRSGPRRLVTFNMDWDGDRSSDEIYSRVGIFDGNFRKLSNSINSSYIKTSDIDEFPPIVADVQGDHREEIIWYDTNEIVIVHNADPLTVDPLPSPRRSLSYRLRYANSNHCNAYYFDWTALGREGDNIP